LYIISEYYVTDILHITIKALNKIVLRSINISAPGNPLRESFQSKEFEKTP